MKKIITTLIILAILIIPIYSATTQIHTVGGSVGDKLDLIQVVENLSLGGALDVGVVGHLLSSYLVLNNNRAGYNITIGSGKDARAKGQLIAALAPIAPAPLNPGDIINYTIDIQDSGTISPAHWGQIFPDTLAVELDIDKILNLNSVTKATFHGAFQIVMNVEENTGAFEDSYSDIITVTIADI